jgi:hypothetical protein
MYSDYVKKLTAACEKRNWKLDGQYEFLSIRINEGAKKSVCFAAGIHGDEPAGPEAILKFVKEGSVPDDVFVMLMPVINSWGYAKGTRRNAARKDINRRFCDKVLTGEAAIVSDLLKEHPVSMLCSMHEWPGQNGFYMYASDKEKKEAILGIPKIASEWFRIINNRKINDEFVENGIIWHPEKKYRNNKSKSTLENRVFLDKTHYVCLETPSETDLGKRCTCQFTIMEYIIKGIL